MKRLRTAGLVLLVLLALAFLLVDFQLAGTAEQANASQSVAQAQVGSSPPGTTLRVYVDGSESLVRELKQQISGAILGPAGELPFAAVAVADEIPPDSYDMPFLAILVQENRGFWTPVYASRHVTATMLYAYGRSIDRDRVVSAAPDGQSFNFTGQDCRGECTEARRTVELNATIRGLVSLPHMRAYTAGKLAAEAVTLVKGGLPDHLNPAKWPDRAHTLAREALGARQSGYFTSFQRQPGCRGGLVMVGDMSDDKAWSLMYYDADRDAITETLSRSDLQAKLPGVSLPDSIGLGANEKGITVHLGGGTFASIPAGTCGLSGWRLEGSGAAQR